MKVRAKNIVWKENKNQSLPTEFDVSFSSIGLDFIDFHEYETEPVLLKYNVPSKVADFLENKFKREIINFTVCRI